MLWIAIGVGNAYTKKLVDLGFYNDNARKETIENPMETAT